MSQLLYQITKHVPLKYPRITEVGIQDEVLVPTHVPWHSVQVPVTLCSRKSKRLQRPGQACSARE